MPRSEKELIAGIRRRAQGRKAASSLQSVVAGIGDDCAVLRVPAKHELLVTTDFSLEGVHFRRDWDGPETIGRRCLTRGLSDIAAMGGIPRAVFLSLAIPGKTPQKWVDRFLQGLLYLAEECDVSLAGGDTAQSSEGILADIVVVGSVPRGKAVLRSGANAGDGIYVTGGLGGAAEVLRRRLGGKSSKAVSNPVPRLGVGQWLRERGKVSAMIDLSDGLSTDLEHICQESGVGAEIEVEGIPRAGVGAGKVGIELALHGGDDYELLFTSASVLPAKIGGVEITRIGRVTRSRGMRMIDATGKSRALKAAGWEHFR